MGKKSSQSSRKISNKTDKKYLNSLIKVLKPKVFITDSSNFKTLVQELTGNGNPIPFPSSPSPSPSPPPPPLPLLPPIQEPVMEIPVIEIEENGYQERSSLDESSVEYSSDASMPAADSAQEVYVSETFNVLETASCWNIQKMERVPTYGDIESWLLQIDDSSSYDSDDIAVNNIPPFQQEASFFYDLSSLV